MKGTLLFAILAITIVSCKKSTQSKTESSKGLLVTKATRFITPDSMLLERAFTYDNSNRLVMELDTQKFSGNIKKITTINNYQYDSNGNMVNYTYIQGDQSGAFTVYYVNNQPSYVTEIQTDGKIVTNLDIVQKYVIENQKVIRIDPISGYSTTFAYLNNNATMITMEYFGSPVDTIKSIFTYGNKNSPYKNSRTKWMLDFDPFDTLQEYSENDKESYISTSSINNSQTKGIVQNIYNTLGYPIKSITTTDNPSSVETETYTYISAK